MLNIYCDLRIRALICFQQLLEEIASSRIGKYLPRKLKYIVNLRRGSADKNFQPSEVVNPTACKRFFGYRRLIQ